MSDESLFPPPAPDFSDPLGLLRACHQRILNHCDGLERLAAHLKEKGGDGEAKSLGLAIFRYFNTAGKHHHQDEEQDLFPELARQSLKLADRVHRLRQQHEAIDELWGQIAPLTSNPMAVTDTERFATLVTEFCALQRDHVAQENEELLDIAQHIFGNEELKQLGKKMAERRGINLGLL